MRSVFLLICLGILFVSCKKEPVVSSVGMPYPKLPATPFSYDDFDAPSYLQGGVYDFFNSTPGSNPITKEGATLGRVLFYDKQLSKNNTVSCASCHHQDKAFTDGLVGSIGLYGEATSRNSMAIVNSFMGFRFFWDQRAVGLEELALMPIQHPVEMDMSLDELEIKLTKLPYYSKLFDQAFGDPTITRDRIALALAQFMRSIYSISSKYDEGVETNFANYTAQELQGKDLFFVDARTNCNNCHQTHYFFDSTPHNNGLESNYVDQGVGGLTGNSSNFGKFKTPTLRNIAHTAPYMHDGRFSSLEEVVEFYNSGIQPHVNLDDRLTTNGVIGGPPRQMNLTPQEKEALVAFLKTLSDPSLFTNERWSNPFE